MNKKIINIGTSFLILMGIVGFTGCATNRGTLEVNAQHQYVSNPQSNHKVYIRNVVDNRVFEASPKEPSTPSLKYSEQITDKLIKERAIARKRNGFGQALGDILLQAGNTVGALLE